MNVHWRPGGPWMSRFSILGASFLTLMASAQPFVEISTSLPSVFNASASWGDYDNDGDTDLLLTGDTGSTTITRIYRNDNGSLVDSNAGLPGLSEGTAIWADYNGDGWLDFGLTGNGTAGRTSRIYRNNGNGTFTNINANLPGLESATLAWGDYDNDGDLDFFLTGYTGSAYVGAIYRNDGSDTFTDSGITTIRGGAAGSAAWADFDNDGDLDLLFAGFTSDTTSGQSSRLYRNNNGAFTNITSIALTAMSETSVAWGDYDNDGDLDILMAGSSISGVQSFPMLRLYRNNTSGTSFTSIITAMGGAQNCSVAWGDYDNDGDLDAAIAGYNASFQPFAKIIRNDGGGVFTDTLTPLTGVIDASMTWCDYDNDADLDLVLTGRSGSTNVTKIYRNETPSINFPPFAPFGLSSFVSEKTATVNWADGGDNRRAFVFAMDPRTADRTLVSGEYADPVDGNFEKGAGESFDTILDMQLGSDGFLYVFEDSVPGTTNDDTSRLFGRSIYRVDLASGDRELWWNDRETAFDAAICGAPNGDRTARRCAV